MKLLFRVIETALGFLLGADWVRNWVLPPETIKSNLISKAIQELDKTSFAEVQPISDKQSSAGEASPVFLLSAGWGSGSTLLQRLILSSEKYIVWGESFDQAAPIQRLAMTISPFRSDWPPDYHFDKTDDLLNLSNSWVANLSPSVEVFKAAHRQFIDTWLGSIESGNDRINWGLKEVRLTIDHARYLKWVYPEAKFIFIYRDVHGCYRSCRKTDWFSVWPDYKATHLLAFAHHWKYLLNGFTNGSADVDGLLISYEDLISDPKSISKLEAYLGIDSIDSSLLEEKLGSIGGGSRGDTLKPLSVIDKWLINSITGNLRRQMGYS